jgi:RimJ/RimL family protein N-acetyltransferase
VLLRDDVVSLSPPSEDDAPEIARAVRASLDTLTPWMPWATRAYSADTAVHWMTAARAGGQQPFVIRDPSGAIVGACGLQQADVANRCVQVGYWLATAHTGRGYMTRAARLLIGHALSDLGYHRVEILISVENVRSQRVAERLRARLEATLAERIEVAGAWHDAHLYSVVGALPTDDA